MSYKSSMRMVSLTCVLALLWTTLSMAQEMAAPMKLQFPLFLKIMVFDRNLKARVGDEIVIGIVYQRKFRRSLKARDEFVSAMEESPIEEVEEIPIRQVSIDVDEVDLENAISENEIDVLYITPVRALEIGKITSLSQASQIRP